MTVLRRGAKLGGELRLVVVLGALCAGLLSFASRADADVSAVAVDASLHATVVSAVCSQPYGTETSIHDDCVATVTDRDASPSTPTGVVIFIVGIERARCTLSGSGASASCEASFSVPVSEEGASIELHYGADANHAQSLGTATYGGYPQLTQVTQSATAWYGGWGLPSAGAARARAPVGTTFGFTLDRPARVWFLFTYRAIGRLVGGRCVAQTNANRRGARCLRTVRALFSRQAHAGRTRLHFEGRLDRKRKLPPGFYRLIIFATANGQRSKPAVLRFRILARQSQSRIHRLKATSRRTAGSGYKLQAVAAPLSNSSSRLLLLDSERQPIEPATVLPRTPIRATVAGPSGSVESRTGK